MFNQKTKTEAKGSRIQIKQLDCSYKNDAFNKITTDTGESNGKRSNLKGN